MISNPADRKAIREALQEISNSLTRVDAERDLVKDIIADLSEKHELPKKTVAKLAKVYHKQNFTEEQQQFSDFEELYAEITAKDPV